MGDVIYDCIGIGYSQYRRPDPRIAAHIAAALGSSLSVLNVGAGTGSYEPQDRFVVAIEPSVEMLRQRPQGAARVIRASADLLPIRDDSFEAALAILTVHHWPNWQIGLREMQRVACDRVVILTWDPQHDGFWLVRDYLPEILEIDRPIFPSLTEIEQILGPIAVRTVPIPADCLDGFLGAYWRRPAMYLNATARQAISTFARLKASRPALRRLEKDLADGTWERLYGELLWLSELDIGYRLVLRCRT